MHRPVSGCGHDTRPGRSRWRAASPSRRTAAIAAATALTLLAGCSAVSSPQEAGRELMVKIDTSKLIPTHAFGAHCFGGFGCNVRYDNKLVRNRPYAEANPDVPIGSYEARLIAPYAGIKSFPTPAKINWISLDGSRLSAEIDIATIVSEWLAYKGDAYETEIVPASEPEVLLVVLDRTVEVLIRRWVTNPERMEDPKRMVERMSSKTY